ncbi:putative beta-glucosidase D [Pseudocercospora fuligena]|uniref:beta-glucosidase n=1 Tax=Pseudocercospora fuligena TaxID=685502 RepID=A0A8H6R9Q6_9PEZI|nr:putative beta-glucosidase D [Pseudocercospora fuligena]
MRASCLILTTAALLVGAEAANSSSSAALLSSGHVHLGEYQDAYNKAKAFVANLTNAQKVSIITGGSINGTSSWTALANKDGFAGINGQYFVSSFPMGGALAMTWDRAHMEAEAKAAGDEFYMMGYNLINGPVASPFGRTPYSGRLAEGFAPDPYLSGIAMEKTVKGMNAAGVVTASRHFLLNEQERNRSASLSSSTTSVYSSNADDKTTNELYLWPFADAVRAGTGAIMCAMNGVNGTVSCENSKLLSDLLKAELGFPGLVMPDVGSQSTSYGSANAGLDYGSSQLWSADILNAGIANGSFTQARLDDMAVRNVIGYYYAGLDNGNQPSQASTTEYRSVRGNHSKLIREIARDSLVLLKNDNTSDRGLPLKQPNVISVFGAHAGPAMAGPNFAFSVMGMDDPYQGHLATGGGSGQGSMGYLITPLHALTARAVEDGSMIRYLANDTYSSSSSSGFGGGGQESGNAIVEVLYGDTNPSGKLPYTIAKNESDYPVSICYTAECNFSEGVHIDYRYFDKNNVSVRYPFGHGLSYTSFSYGDVSVSATNETALESKYPAGVLTLGGYADLFDEVVSVTTTIQNTGSIQGSEVAQLYINYPASADQPIRQLRGFEKVPLAAGEKQEVTFSVRRRDISYWDVAAQQWAIASGTYTFAVGSSSRDLRGSDTLQI